MSQNVFSQNAISSKVPPGYSGWLYHEHELMLGSNLQPQNYLHIHNNADADGSPHNAFLQITNPYTQTSSTALTPTDGLRIGIGTLTTNFDAVINQQENANLFFYTNNLQRVVIDNNGFVGIGINSPNHNLQIYSTEQLNSGGGIGSNPVGGGRSNVDYGAIQLTNATTGSTATDGLLIETRGNAVTFWQQENADMIFKTGADNRIVLKADGKTGINNNFPNADLDVKGTFKVHYGSIVNEFSTDGTLADNSDEALPTEQAVKTPPRPRL